MPDETTGSTQGPVGPREAEAQQPVRRRRYRRYRRRPAGGTGAATVEATAPAPAALPETAPASGRPEGEVRQEPAQAPGGAPRRRPHRPRRRRAPAEVAAPVVPGAAALSPAQRPFSHATEEEFGRILNFYGVKWLYEPRSFPLRWEGERVTEMFTPDFYLPELDLYVELTTLRQSLVTEKNRKLRRLRELYPETNVKLLYRRDIHRLLAKYGFGPLAQEDVPGIERVLFTKAQVERRVAELGTAISRDYAGKSPLLIGVLRGVFCFMADLMRHITLPLSVEFMAVSYYSGGENGGVHITKELDLEIEGKDVLLVEDIVDTGMTLNHLLRHLEARKPASLKVCTLLDKRVRRLVPVKLDYVGFEVPDEFVVGYGLDYLERHRNLPFLGVLKPSLPPGPSRESERPK